MFNLIGEIFMIAGALLGFISSILLYSFADFNQRLSVIVKAITLGLALIMLGAFFSLGFSPIGLRAVLCLIFVLITVPAVAFAMASVVGRRQ